MTAMEKFAALPWAADTMTRKERFALRRKLEQTAENVKKCVHIGIPSAMLVVLLVTVFAFDVDILQILRENFLAILKGIISVAFAMFAIVGIGWAGLCLAAPYLGLQTGQYKTKDDVLHDGAVAFLFAIVALGGVAFAYSKWSLLMAM